MPLELLHPITSAWFKERFETPTEPQKLGWPSIARGEDTLIAAPTGSGKTLTAFMICIDQLVRKALKGKLKDECKVLYVSPLKALASDVRKNLEIPLEEIQARLKKNGHGEIQIHSQVRTGDTPANERQKLLRKPPHILVTTPESLYLLLTAERGREILTSIETVIIDEIHALARDKRGSHLSLSLERLKALTKKRPTFIGLSATQKPIEDMAHFLVGKAASPPTIIDVGHTRKIDLGLLVPDSPLSTVCSGEQWSEVYQLLSNEIQNHRSTLIFVNTRRLAERVAYRLGEYVGEDQVLCHHGSLSRTRRLTTEIRLKNGELKAIVATASLELGIDIGYIDLVCQIGVPYSIATFLQRLGRSGHAIKAIPKGRLVPLTRDELVESLSMIRAVRHKQLDSIQMPKAPLDILCQQLIAECAGRGAGNSLTLDEAYEIFTSAWPYRDLSRQDFLSVVQMAAEGFAPGRRRYAYLLWDRLKDRLTVRSGARLAALTSGGAIPETGEYRVVLEEDGVVVGSVNEDFAVESLAGDIFVLGTHSWQIVHVRNGQVVVRDAAGKPPTIPFWEGEAPGRTREFSAFVADLRGDVGEHLPEEKLQDAQFMKLESVGQIRLLERTPFDSTISWLQEVTGITDSWPLLQTVHYIAVQKAALGLIPSQKSIVFERFFDEMGGMQLVIHSSYGARLNRAWGLALRKRFCRQFDFELQASADDDGIVLSLGPQHSFPLEHLFKMLNESNIEHFLTQALLAAPMFEARWRWNTTRALAVLRQMGGKRIAPPLQRFRANDLLAAVFPAQTACQENQPGDIEIPDHPLVRQTIHDCLTEAMDIEGAKVLMAEIHRGEVKLIAKDTREPSPFTYQLLNAYPYAFLDETELQDRRTRAVATRASFSIAELQDLDRFDSLVIKQVKQEAWPTPRTPEELYEILVATPAFPLEQTHAWGELVDVLSREGRTLLASVPTNGREQQFLVAAESVPILKAAYKQIQWQQELKLPEWILRSSVEPHEARKKILSGWLEISGAISDDELKQLFMFDSLDADLAAIENAGTILRCRLQSQASKYTHWCARGLLRRMHKLTVEGLREQIQPVSVEDYLEFLLHDHHLKLGTEQSAQRSQESQNSETLLEVVHRLAGYEAPALAWETELFAGRLAGYDASLLDRLTSSGLVAFGRFSSKKRDGEFTGKAQGLTVNMPLTFCLRRDLTWLSLEDGGGSERTSTLSSNAQAILETLKANGAQFVDELMEATHLLHTQVEVALGELTADGLITCDQFEAYRQILSPLKKERKRLTRGVSGRVLGRSGIEATMGGRWTLLPKRILTPEQNENRIEKWAWLLLGRYGVVFHDLLARESLAPSWGTVVRALRRLEARGEIRGGRFIKGVSGEQFSLPQAYDGLLRLREERQKKNLKSGYAVISSVDPLNLFGILTKEDRIPANHANRILIVDGKARAVYRNDKVEASEPISEEMARSLRLLGSFRGK